MWHMLKKTGSLDSIRVPVKNPEPVAIPKSPIIIIREPSHYTPVASVVENQPAPIIKPVEPKPFIAPVLNVQSYEDTNKLDLAHAVKDNDCDSWDTPLPEPDVKTECQCDDMDKVTADLKAKQISVWALQLLDHGELTKVDKIGLPKYFKTQEDLTALENRIFEMAAHEPDVSYITLATDIVGQIEELFEMSHLS